MGIGLDGGNALEFFFSCSRTTSCRASSSISAAASTPERPEVAVRTRNTAVVASFATFLSLLNDGPHSLDPKTAMIAPSLRAHNAMFFSAEKAMQAKPAPCPWFILEVG